MARSQRNKGTSRSAKSSAQRKLEQMRREQRARARRIQVLAGLAAVAVAGIVAAIVVLTAGGTTKPHATSTPRASGTSTPAASGQLGPENIPLETGPPLAPASTAATGQTVAGISCVATEQTAYHIHTHLAVYVNGASRQIPLGIGAVEPTISQTPQGPFAGATKCFYWLHTHANDGIIHVESPTQRGYTLGQFFAIWRQPLSRSQVGPATGPVTAFVNGARYGGDPATIPLSSRGEIQLNVGSQVPPAPVDWSKSQL